MTCPAKQSLNTHQRHPLEFAALCKLALLITIGVVANLGSINNAYAKNGYYQWKDAQGQMHYSQKPPSSRANTSEQAASETTFVSTGYRGRFTTNDGDTSKQSFEGSNTRKPAPTNQNQNAIAGTNNAAGRPFEKDQQRCDKAKRNLQQLSLTYKITLTDENGNQRLLSAQEKQLQRQAALKAIEESC